jgi:hypothetical protein
MLAPMILVVALASPQGHKPQRHPAAQTETATNPRGSEQAPLVVKVQPTPKTDQETAKEQQQEDRQAAETIGGAPCSFLSIRRSRRRRRSFATSGEPVVDERLGILGATPASTVIA